MVRTAFAAVLASVGLLVAPGVAAQDDPSILTSEVARASNDSLLWGPYKPNLYFGVRPRLPKSLAAGLMWAKVDNFEDVQYNFRHTCEQNEGMAGYGWDEYDVRNGGQQVIRDEGNKIDITTSFVKIPGGTNGGSWGVRVKGTPRANALPRHMTTVIFYASLEGLGSLDVENEREGKDYEGDVTLNGNSAGLGEYKLVVKKGTVTNPPAMHDAYKDKPLDRSIVHSSELPEEMLWPVRQILYRKLKDEIDEYVATYGTKNMPPPWQTYTMAHKPGPGNMHMVQRVFEGEFEFDIIFSSGSAPEEVTSEDLTKEIKSVKTSFNERFGSVFDLKAPYNTPKYVKFAKSMFSNLFGGIGYFYGTEVVDRSYAPEYEEENEGFWEETEAARRRQQEAEEGPSELFSSIPSRPFFPRGFLWDEGFHLLPIADWDMDIALEIVKSWFNLMDSDGWIGREQILGEEARSKVPPEFRVQYPHYANPPTLFFVLDAFVRRLAEGNNGSGVPAKESLDSGRNPLQNTLLESPEAANQYLQSIYPLLKRQYYWFRRTQAGDLSSYDREAFSSKEAYRWRGRTVRHVLTSGMDDYPRPQPPHPGELHVDLISWIGVMAKSLHGIASYLGESEDVKEFARHENAILRNIDDLHWSEKAKTYCDASIDDFEENVLVCHKGYISIIPFLTGLLPPDSPRLGAILDTIGDPEQLWSDYGIRSLSKSDEYYGTDENYWRGPIWMNINYLAVRELLNVAQSQSTHAARARDLYTKLRRNLVENVFKSWEETGFAWEQYNPEDGHGQRTQHFTGWTSLVVKIMGMPELSGGKAGVVRDEL